MSNVYSDIGVRNIGLYQYQLRLTEGKYFLINKIQFELTQYFTILTICTGSAHLENVLLAHYNIMKRYGEECPNNPQFTFKSRRSKGIMSLVSHEKFSCCTSSMCILLMILIISGGGKSNNVLFPMSHLFVSRSKSGNNKSLHLFKCDFRPCAYLFGNVFIDVVFHIVKLVWRDIIQLWRNGS